MKILQGIKGRKAVTKIQAAIIIALVAVASMIAGGLYYSTTVSTSKEIVIGAPVPVSGSLAATGIDIKNGYELAQDDINAAGGIKNLGGAKVKFIFADTQSDTTVSASETERLIETYHPVIMTGYYSTATTLAAIPITERNKVPILGPLQQGVKLTTSGYKYFFRNAFRADKTGFIGIDNLMAMVQHFGIPVKTVALIGTNDAALMDVINSTRQAAKDAGLQIVFDETYPPGVTDVSSLVIKLKAAKPDVIIPMSFITESLLLARTLKEYQVDAIAYFAVAGGGILEPDFIKMLGNTSEYYIAGSAWMRDLTKPGLADLVKRYETKYGILMNEHAGQAYSCGWIMKEVIELSATLHPDNPLDGDSIRDAFLKIDITSGPAVLGAADRVKFNENGDNMYPAFVYLQILNGTQHTVWPLNLASAAAVWPQPAWAERP